MANVGNIFLSNVYKRFLFSPRFFTLLTFFIFILTFINYIYGFKEFRGCGEGNRENKMAVNGGSGRTRPQLMEIPSRARSPVAPVRLSRSEPAKSTKLNFAVNTSTSLPSAFTDTPPAPPATGQ